MGRGADGRFLRCLKTERSGTIAQQWLGRHGEYFQYRKIRQKKQRFLDREQLIIDTALALMIEKSIERVTVAEIARQSGIGKGTIYKHFESKAEIMMRIMIDYEKSTAANLQEGIRATDNGNPGAVVKSYFRVTPCQSGS